jgi:iron complex transport system substrate-binding protein
MLRSVFSSLLLGLACITAVAPAHAQDGIVITDVAGRTVKLQQPAKRILLGEGRQLLALALLHPEPVALLAGWPADLSRQDPTTYARYRAKFPKIDEVTIVGRGTADTFSVEQSLALQPDIAIFSGGYGPSSRSTEIIAQMEAAGIPVVFIDFVARPLENTLPSIRILGQVLGREEAAADYSAFYEAHMRRITDRLAASKPKPPNVFMHAHAGLGECCNSPGRATIGAFIDAAGGHNIAADILKQPFAQLNLEYVISRAPDIYVGTGGIHLIGKGGLVMGPGIDANTSRQALAQVVQHAGLAALGAVQQGRVHGIWHLFANVPMNFLAVEALAKWFHPELFQDIDPDASLRELNERFLSVPLEGTYWLSLK